MRIIKCGLNEVVSSPESFAFFNGVVQRIHEIKVSAHLLCKAWVLERFERHESLPAGQGALGSLFQDAVRAVGGDAQNARLQALCRDISCWI